MKINSHKQLMLFIIILLTPSQVLSNNEDLSVCADQVCDYDPSDCPEVQSDCDLAGCADLLSPTDSGIMDYSCFWSSPRTNLDLVGTVEYDGYDVETHYVTTSDGYILTIFRITKPGCVIDGSKEPVVMAHGLFLGAFFWLAPIRNHVYIFADQCYVVYLINVRGNTYGRNHTTLNPDTDPAFWDFDFDEMAMKDLPACLDYVLATNGQSQVIYVGHSQGVTMAMILLSLKPEYNDVMSVIFALSTTAWLNHATSPVLEFGQLTTLPVGLLLDLEFNTEILRQGGILQTTAEVGCGTTPITYPVCTLFVFFFFGYNKCQIDCQTLTDVVHRATQGSSLKTFHRWNVIKQTEFRQRDRGIWNIPYYGMPEAPKYPLENISAKMIFFISCHDNVSTWQDMQTLLSELSPGVADYCLVKKECWSHVDFVLGRSLKTVIADPMLEYLNTGNLVCSTEL